MTLSRRRFIALVGGGAVLAAGASATAFTLTRTPHSALAPWDAAGGYAEPRMRALSYAILAPNPHNRQPWEAELIGDDTIRIWRDPARNLPQSDPEDRQLTIGMGCFLELLAIAAGETGHRAELALFPEGEEAGAPLAEVRLVPGGRRDALFAHVIARRSCKEPFDDRAMQPADIAVLSELATIVTEPGQVEVLRSLTWEAFLVEAGTPRVYGESVELMRFGRAEIEANPDGIDLGGPFLEGLMKAGMLTRKAQLDPASSAYRTGIDIYRTMLAATPAYAVMTSPGNSRADQIGAGRRWIRLNLETTARGLALHPVSQALQEFPEMADLRTRAHSLLAAPGETVQMLGRLGYGPATRRSPRWPLDTRMRNA